MAQSLTLQDLPSGSADLYSARLPELAPLDWLGIGTADELRQLAEEGMFNVPAGELRFELEWAA